MCAFIKKQKNYSSLRLKNGRRGMFDQYCFVKQPQKITDFSLIKKNLGSLDMEGAFAPNKRFADRAIQIIGGNDTDECFCRLLINKFGPSANGLAKKGFLLEFIDFSLTFLLQTGKIDSVWCTLAA